MDETTLPSQPYPTPSRRYHVAIKETRLLAKKGDAPGELLFTHHTLAFLAMAEPVHSTPLGNLPFQSGDKMKITLWLADRRI
jgi:hypothetical protein